MTLAPVFRLLTLLALGLALSLQGVIGCDQAAAATPQAVSAHCVEQLSATPMSMAHHDEGQPADEAGSHDCSKACHTAAMDPAAAQVPAPEVYPAVLFGPRLVNLAGAGVPPATPPPRLG